MLRLICLALMLLASLLAGGFPHVKVQIFYVTQKHCPLRDILSIADGKAETNRADDKEKVEQSNSYVIH